MEKENQIDNNKMTDQSQGESQLKKNNESKNTDSVSTKNNKQPNSYHIGTIAVLLVIGAFLLIVTFNNVSENGISISIKSDDSMDLKDDKKTFFLPEGFLPDDSDARRGDGPIYLIEYSDYECPFCARFHPVAQTLVDMGLVTWVYRHFPLHIHPTAGYGAIVAECVKDKVGVESFWNYTDAVFANQRSLSRERYELFARAEGLMDDQLRECTTSGGESSTQQMDRVQMQLKDVFTLGIDGTPGTYLVNPETLHFRKVSGAQPVEVFIDLINEL